MKKAIAIGLFILSVYQLTAQTTNNVGIGTSSPHSNALLDLTSTDKGLLAPRMTTIQKTAIPTTTASEGLLVYDTDTKSFWYFDGNSWIEAIGPMGPTGPSGQDGVDGKDGQDGATGATGATGSNGAAGAAGATGATGATGAAGSSNAWGLTGNAGTSVSTNFLGTTDAVSLAIKTNNSERIRISSSGNVGIGTTSPLAFFHIEAPASTPVFRARLNGTTKQIITSDGNVGFNTTSPTSYFYYKTPSTMNDWNVHFESDYDDGLARFYNTTSSNESRVLMGATEYTGSTYLASGVIGLALGSSGYGGCGVYGGSNSGDAYGVYGNIPNGTSSSSDGWAVYADGWSGGLTSWYNVSDSRLKKNVSTLNGSLEKIMSLRGVTYNFDKTNFPGIDLDENEKQIGFIAQEVEAIFPEMVREAKIDANDGRESSEQKDAKTTYTVKTVSYSTLIPVLVEAIKEQQKTIESLESRIAELENQK